MKKLYGLSGLDKGGSDLLTRQNEILKVLDMIQKDMQDKGWSLATSQQYAWSEMEEVIQESDVCEECIRKKFFI